MHLPNREKEKKWLIIKKKINFRANSKYSPISLHANLNILALSGLNLSASLSLHHHSTQLLRPFALFWQQALVDGIHGAYSEPESASSFIRVSTLPLFLPLLCSHQGTHQHTFPN